MAPESERAMDEICKHPTRKDDKFDFWRCVDCGYIEPKSWNQPKPNEPTLTCSEVVERLPSANDVRAECKELLEKALALIRVKQGSEAEFERLLAHALATFAEKKNRCHLAELSKRERRVQELENLLAKRSGCSRCNDSASRSTSANDPTESRKGNNDVR